MKQFREFVAYSVWLAVVIGRLIGLLSEHFMSSVYERIFEPKQ